MAAGRPERGGTFAETPFITFWETTQACDLACKHCRADAHRGEVFPSGFLPLACGSVRREGLAAIYRRHPVFAALRDPDTLGGKCGACELRRICGGSRARVYAMTGDLFAEDVVGSTNAGSVMMN